MLQMCNRKGIQMKKYNIDKELKELLEMKEKK